MALRMCYIRHCRKYFGLQLEENLLRTELRDRAQKRELATCGSKPHTRKLNNGDLNFVSRGHSDSKHANKNISLGTEGKCHLLKFMFGKKKVDNYNACQNKLSNVKNLLIWQYISFSCHEKIW